MISVTERAATELQALLEANDAPPDQGVKLVPAGTGTLGVTIGPPAEGDEIILHGDSPLLIVDGSIAPLLDGQELDIQPDAGGVPQFILSELSDPGQ